MRTRVYTSFIILLLMALACGRPAAPEVDTQATVEAAVAATDAAQVAMEATIEAAVQATDTAQIEQQTSAPETPGDAAAPATPISSQDYTAMSEEELVALINQAVAAAGQAAGQSAGAASEAVSDEAVTQEEAQTVELYIEGTDQAIAYAEELLAAYADLYGELATDAVDELEAVADSLAEIEENTAAMSDSLAEINESVESAEQTVAEIEAAAQATLDKAGQLQGQSQAWVTQMQAKLTGQTAQIEAATGQIEALKSALDFVTASQAALVDNQISPEELKHIAQLGASASAGLEGSGQPALQDLSGQVNEIIERLAGGDIAASQSQLAGLTAALGSMPNTQIPDLGNKDISLPGKPSLPEKPARPSR